MSQLSGLALVVGVDRPEIITRALPSEITEGAKDDDLVAASWLSNAGRPPRNCRVVLLDQFRKAGLADSESLEYRADLGLRIDLAGIDSPKVLCVSDGFKMIRVRIDATTMLAVSSIEA